MEKCPKFLISEDGVSEERRLELRLGPPGEHKSPLHSLRYISSTQAANAAVPNSSHKRVAPAQVVGWPPVRSFRKNLAHGSSAKPVSGSEAIDNSTKVAERMSESSRMLVKINMDGVPIGRKIDLNSYKSYENLSYAIDELFRGLLAAQRDCSGGRGKNMMMEETPITKILDNKEEYTLVYEDNEGDRMLVGDVPWHMFVSTAKRLRVLRTSELSTLHLSSSKQEKDSTIY